VLRYGSVGRRSSAAVVIGRMFGFLFERLFYVLKKK